MQPIDIIQYCKENLDNISVINTWGEQSVFYNPGKTLKKGIYIMTIKEKDGKNDQSSNLNRKNTYRINIGIRKTTFNNLFGQTPKRPAAGHTVEMNYDFTAKNKIMPHPIYSWMSWICCLNPTQNTFEELKPFIKEAYEYAIEKYTKRKKYSTDEE